MMTKIFEHLDSAGLIGRNNVRVNKLIGLPFAKTLDLLDVITANASQPPEDPSPSIHTHCATFDLGGSGDECRSLECRLKSVNELARFAALYSDRVYIHNLLADSAPTWGHPPSTDSPQFRQRLIDDLTVFLELRPLIESGHIVVFSPPTSICPYCYAKFIFGSKADQRLKRAMTQILRDLDRESPVEFSADEYGYAAYFSTAKNLFRHQTHLISYDSLPNVLASHPRLAKRIESGEKILLSQEVARGLGVHNRLAIDVLVALRYQMSVANIVGASYLTHRDIDLKILSYISGDKEFDRRNAIVQKYLSSFVPFANDVPISRLDRLRQREEGAFIQFRSALDKTLQEVLSQKKAFTERDAQTLYADIIAPEIARLDQKVQDAKRDLVRVPLVSAIGMIATIAFGLYAGMIPPELKVAAGALGLTKILFDTITKTGDLTDVKKQIRPEKFYFLWRVRHSARKPQKDYKGNKIRV